METKIRKIDNRWDVKTYREEFGSFSALEVEVGTNGFHGGDAGHGCCTYFRLENLCDTYMDASYDRNLKKLELTLGGDSELESFVDALEFAVSVLKSQIKGEIPFKEEITHTDKQVAFANYLKEVVDAYKNNKSLRGISAIRQKYHVTGLTKEQFFELGLDELASRGIDVMSNPTFCDSVYEYILHHSQIIPKWE